MLIHYTSKLFIELMTSIFMQIYLSRKYYFRAWGCQDFQRPSEEQSSHITLFLGYAYSDCSSPPLSPSTHLCLLGNSIDENGYDCLQYTVDTNTRHIDMPFDCMYIDLLTC
jgi:hypothetical protein